MPSRPCATASARVFRLWPSRSGKPPSRVATSGAPRTRSRRRASRPARSAARRSSRIAVDALGGDRAPDEVVAGALEAAADGIDVVLYGPAGIETRGLPLVEAADRIDMAEKPAE